MTEGSPESPAHVWVDGRLVPAAGPHVSAFDRGFQLGDAIFETVRAHGGRPVELSAHLARLRYSAGKLAIALPADLDALIEEAVGSLLVAEGLAATACEAAVRITVSRGAPLGRELAPREPIPPTVVVQAWTARAPSAALLARGLMLVVSSVRHDPHSPLAGVKSTSRADHVYARLEAERAGADDALLLTADGHLAEATTATLFLVRDGELATPTLECGILAGTTREWALAWAANSGLRTFEGWLTVDDLLQADEAFLGSSVAGILPVTRLGERAIGGGRPGRWALRARAARGAFVAEGGWDPFGLPR